MAWIGAEKLFDTNVYEEAAREEKTKLRPMHKLRTEKEACSNCGYRRKDMCKPFKRKINDANGLRTNIVLNNKDISYIYILHYRRKAVKSQGFSPSYRVLTLQGKVCAYELHKRKKDILWT